MDTNDLKHFIKSKKFYIAIAFVFLMAILAGTFSLGVAVGYYKARFSYSWGENYHRNFGGPKQGFMKDFGRDMSGSDFIEAHGTFGKVLKIDGSSLVIQGVDNVEKLVATDANTEIRRFHDIIRLNDLRTDESVIVIGEPGESGQGENGQIDAKFIRVLPVGSPAFSPLTSPSNQINH